MQKYNSFTNNKRLTILRRVNKPAVNINSLLVSLHQVKLAILGLKEIKDAHVEVVQYSLENNLSIICHLITTENAPVNIESFHRRLRVTLPQVAIPREFFVHPHFPVKENGNLDAEALTATVENFITTRKGLMCR